MLYNDCSVWDPLNHDQPNTWNSREREGGERDIERGRRDRERDRGRERGEGRGEKEERILNFTERVI